MPNPGSEVSIEARPIHQLTLAQKQMDSGHAKDTMLKIQVNQSLALLAASLPKQDVNPDTKP